MLPFDGRPSFRFRIDYGAISGFCFWMIARQMRRQFTDFGEGAITLGTGVRQNGAHVRQNDFVGAVMLDQFVTVGKPLETDYAQDHLMIGLVVIRQVLQVFEPLFT